MPGVVIVGGGISGLSLAFRLGQRAPHLTIQVLESGDRLGGKVWTTQRDGFLIEHGPNGFLDLKPSSYDLCQELGLGDQLISGSEAARKNRFLYRGNNLEPLPGSLLEFLRSPIMSWKGKLSLLAERLRPGRTETTDESVADFARRRLGKEAAENLADAFVAGIHAGDPAALSLPAAFPRLAALERQYGSILKGMSATAKEKRRLARSRGEPVAPSQRLWSLVGGLRVWIEALAARLDRPPLTGVAVDRLVPPAVQGQPWTIFAESGRNWCADAVVLTCPAPAQARLTKPLNEELARQIQGIEYAPVLVVSLGYRTSDVPKPLDGFGYLTPQRLRRDVLGVQWCSSIFPGRCDDEHVLLRAMCGGAGRPDIVDWSDDRLLSAVRKELRCSLGISAPPTSEQIIRWPMAIPQYRLGHLQKVATIEKLASSLPGLFLAGNPYGGVSLNDCTERASVVANQIVTFLQTSRSN
jgi:protoporphyrinogen/coproporphyrinogen III oxidase